MCSSSGKVGGVSSASEKHELRKGHRGADVRGRSGVNKAFLLHYVMLDSHNAKLRDILKKGGPDCFWGEEKVAEGLRVGNEFAGERE